MDVHTSSPLSGSEHSDSTSFFEQTGSLRSSPGFGPSDTGRMISSGGEDADIRARSVDVAREGVCVCLHRQNHLNVA